jgi:putative PEP-CTERM system histidine kinase
MHESALQIALPFLSAAAATVLALLVVARFQRGPVHWGLAAGLSALAVTQVGNGMALLADPGLAQLQWRRVALAGEMLIPPGLLVFSVAFARSNAKELLEEWKPFLWASGLIALVFLAVLGSERFLSMGVGGAHMLLLGPTGRLFAGVYLTAHVLILGNLEQTFRHANEQARWYIKFPLVGLGLLCMYFVYQMADLLLYSVWHRELGWLSGTVAALACGLIGYGLLRRPIPDVHLYISRKVVSGSLTFLLVGGVLIGTALIASVIHGSGLPGSMMLSALFALVALTGLTFVLLSAHVRHAVARFIERHFFPQRYDYRTRWLEVTETISARGNPEQIAWQAVGLFKGMFGAKTVSIWTVDNFEETAWTRVATHHASATPGRVKDEGAIQSWLDQHDEFQVAATDRRGVPAALEHELAAMDAALVLPLKAGHKPIGWVALGYRASGAAYSHQDRDLMRCIAAQVGDRLQHLLLADRLIMTREMEAFYECSTFFLHDLKNFVATLSLVIQNAERHGRNPEFQQAAMATIASTVRKMTALMGTVAALSRDPSPKVVKLDLNGLVDDVLKSFNGSAPAALVRDAKPVPPVQGDPDQLRQVVLNLVLNAQDAVGPEGRIVLRTEPVGRAAQLIVEDNGCGMDHATMTELFRPFRTTKGRGLGIGLYQCRKILQAHGGVLEVESEKGKGTRFTIRLQEYSRGA